MKRKALTLLVILSLSLPVFAHGNMEHVLGTVVKVSKDSLSVRVSDGTIKVVLFDDQTRFLKGSSAATLNDIKIGTRVVVHAHKHGDLLEAAEIKIGTNATTNHPVSDRKEMI
jgi:hypothetical protein